MFDILIKRRIVRAHSHSPSVSPRSFMLTLSFMSCSAEIVVSMRYCCIWDQFADREKNKHGSRMEARMCERLEAAGGREEWKLIQCDGWEQVGEEAGLVAWKSGQYGSCYRLIVACWSSTSKKLQNVDVKNCFEVVKIKTRIEINLTVSSLINFLHMDLD